MNKYNFDILAKRKNTNSVKYDAFESTLPMWVADMDFVMPSQIKEAIQKDLDIGAIGYSLIPDDFFNAFINFYKDRYNAHFLKEQMAYVMNKKDHGKVWFLDPTGMPTAGWGLSLSAYEMAQIGLMVLNKGVYNNKRIVSEKWINLIGKSYVSLDYLFGNQDYGYLWWLPHRTTIFLL